MARIISLIASSTEILCALGLQSQIVGRSHECDHPPEIGKLPVCTEPRFPVDGDSLQIDQRVKAGAQAGDSLYRIFEDRLQALAPDVIVTQAQCEVCAVSEAEVERALATWSGPRPRIVSLGAESLSGLWEDIRQVAQALAVPQQGQRLIGRLRQRMADIGDRADRLPHRPTVACIEWLAPLMAAGNWVPELVELAGGRNVFGQAGRHSPWLSWDALVQADPEVLVILPCGWDIDRTRQDLHFLTEHPHWGKLAAVKRGRVYLADGNPYFNRPGPRLVESVEILAEILHPTVFRFGHLGKGWVPYQS